MRLSLNFIVNSLIVVLFALALFFTLRVLQTQCLVSQSSPEIPLKSGQKALVTKILDGDEVLVKINSNEFSVRIIGIYAFDPSVNEPLIENIAKTAFHSLEKLILNQEITLVFEQFQKDANQRVLSYLFLNQMDIGLEMLKNGLAMAYLKYPFTQSGFYLAAQNKAQKSKRGLWMIPAASKRARELQNFWRSSHTDGGKN